MNLFIVLGMVTPGQVVLLVALVLLIIFGKHIPKIMTSIGGGGQPLPPPLPSNLVENSTSTELEAKVRCPKCGSEQIQVVKRGYDTTKGCCGFAACGPLGFLFGQHNANQIERVCVKCAHKW